MEDVEKEKRKARKWENLIKIETKNKKSEF